MKLLMGGDIFLSYFSIYFFIKVILRDDEPTFSMAQSKKQTNQNILTQKQSSIHMRSRKDVSE